MEPSRFCARALLATALAVSALLAVASEAAAQSPSPPHAAEAQERFNRGRALFLRNRFAPALTEFRASLELYRSPNSLLYAGLCLARLDRAAEAYTALSDAATLGRSQGDGRYAATGERAQHEATALEPRVARMSIRVEHPPADLAVRIEGDPLPSEAWNHPIAHEPGEVTVSAGSPGYLEFHRTVRLSLGGLEDIAVALVPEPSTVATVSTPDVLVPPITAPPGGSSAVVDPDVPLAPPPSHALRNVGWITGGAGVLGLVGFVVFGQLAASRYSTVMAACHDTRCPASFNDDINSGVTLQTAANVSLGVGAGLVGVGATFLLLSALSHHGSPPPEDHAPRVEAWFDPSHGSLGVRGAF